MSFLPKGFKGVAIKSEWSGQALPGMPLWPGPDEIREEFIHAFGVDWTASYLDPSGWVEATRTIMPRHGFAADKIIWRAKTLLKALDLKVFTPSPRSGPR